MKMFKLVLFFTLLATCFLNAQVGINTTSPNASLDIRSSNAAAPNNTDGILIPKIDDYPSVNPTSVQDGMLVYVTGSGSVVKGFYYWNNMTTTWVSIAANSIEKINDLIDGKSDNDGTDNGSSIFLGINSGVNDDETNNYNAGFGISALTDNTSGSNNSAFGNRALRMNTTGSRNVGLGSRSGWNSNGSNNVFIGYESGFSELNSNRLYIENSSSTSPLVYGEFDNDLLRVNGDLEIVKTTNSSLKVKTNDGNSSSLSLVEGADYGFEFLYTGSDDKLSLWSRTFTGNEGERMTWLKNGKVGINDTAPDALLDIEATNSATPTNTDGILIPRVDAFPATNPTAIQNGMLVFLNTDNTFYFWRNSTNSWKKLSTIERIDDLLDGKSDSDGSNNGSSIFIGVNAGLTDNSADNRNVAIGYQASEDNLSGTNNTAIGYQSLQNNRVDYNVAIGNKALFSTIVGNQNTAVGYATLELNTGRYNTAVGYIALQSNTNGDGNTTLGNQALSSNTNGDNNVAIGYRSMLDNSTGGNNVAMGYHALQNNISGDSNVAIGGAASYIITTGSSNTAIGQGATALAANFYNTSAIGAGATPNSPNQVRLGNASVAVIGGYANWSNFSDSRLKTNIKEDIVGLDFIKKLRPVSYNLDMEAIARFEKTPDSLRLRDAEQLKAKEIQTGFIAQEVEAAAQAVGFDFHGIVKPYDSDGTYALRYSEFVVPLVKAMQEQQVIIEAQKEELKAIRLEIEEIKALFKKD
ncbi:tail fiber domain-containing protein [Psychroserpens ponticola]|uniref:Tail fiber domain-containing protein n=1 Tax=Psychroserpens ponticola TaxID=2932268 RepID=A0ABY7S0F3_9FLAO|nr:tail fiber domain-containing protein [Psychroserpens ponticola]WCO02450.1 tail fiber domain-containing protein [Psychroserpens ponticola]